MLTIFSTSLVGREVKDREPERMARTVVYISEEGSLCSCSSWWHWGPEDWPTSKWGCRGILLSPPGIAWGDSGMMAFSDLRDCSRGFLDWDSEVGFAAPIWKWDLFFPILTARTPNYGSILGLADVCFRWKIKNFNVKKYGYFCSSTISMAKIINCHQIRQHDGGNEVGRT